MQPEIETRRVASRWDGVLCGALAVIAMLASRPFVEIGMIDDYSYVKTAFVFARTGHMVYNGWATAMLGWQILWGALFVKLFGYTFTATRISTIVTAACCVWLTHAIFVRCGVNRRNAIFGTLAIGLSPLFLPLSIMFMTDISGLFVILLCLYCCLRALAACDDRTMLGWLIVASVSGTIGGTARQIAWLGVLVMVPSTAWLLRRRRWVLPVAGLLWALSLATIYAALAWFKRQPFNVPEPFVPPGLTLKAHRILEVNATAGALCLVLLLLPILAAWTPIVPKLKIKTIGVLTIVTLTATEIFHVLAIHSADGGLIPWTGDVVDGLGLVSVHNSLVFGQPPTTFSLTGRVIASVIVVGVLVVFCYAVLRGETLLRSDAQPPARDGFELPWQTLLTLLGPFAFTYCLFLLPRALSQKLIDRYLLPLVVLCMLCLLRLYQDRVSSRLPAISYAVLAVFACFAVLGTHDWCASHRAVLTAVQRIRATGVSPIKIEAGLEYDGMTQIDAVGTLIDPRVTYPPGIDQSMHFPPGLPPQCQWLFHDHTPVLRPGYILAYQQLPCLVESEFAPVEYQTWLPPFHRQMLTLKVPERPAN